MCYQRRNVAPIGDAIQVSDKETHRAKVLDRVIAGDPRLNQVAALLEVSYGQADQGLTSLTRYTPLPRAPLSVGGGPGRAQLHALERPCSHCRVSEVPGTDQET